MISLKRQSESAKEKMEMAKANGWAVVCTTTASDTIYSKYSRCTELRRVDDNDIYKLATILDVNGCWRKLMSIIPKRLDAKACSAPGALNYHEIAAKVGLKYTAQQISLIDGTAERLTPGQSISQVMIDEWKTSGKLNERPTVGVLLQLLVQAEIYSAADFVALQFLNEQKPVRPADGPAALISLDLCTEDLSEDMDVDDGASYQPNTTTLNAAVAEVRGTGMNLDYFDKHMVRRDKSVPQHLENGASCMPIPVPPPRVSRSTRQLEATASNAAPTNASSASSASNAPNMPMLSILNASNEKRAPSIERIEQPQNIPNLSILNGSSDRLSQAVTTSTTLDADSINGGSSAGTSAAATPNVPLITLLIENNSGEINNAFDAAAGTGTTSTATTATTIKPTATETVPDISAMSYNNLPAISALNLNSGSDIGTAAPNDNADNNDSSGTNSLSNDDDDDDEDDDEEDVSLPNLSNSDHNTSNNDSSLTTVTGTSGENSFELTNDSSSASNDDYTNNIPNLSELQQ